MLKKIKSFVSKGGLKCKALFMAVFASLSACAMSVVSFAATEGTDTTTSDPVNIGTMLNTAGETIVTSFNDLIQTMIPIILNVLSIGLVIFGIFALIKYAKKILGKVAG